MTNNERLETLSSSAQVLRMRRVRAHRIPATQLKIIKAQLDFDIKQLYF